MAANRADLAAGTIDAFQTFQPFAEWAINDGGKVLYAAANRGPTAYTSFYTTATLIDRNRESFRAMSVACQKSVGAVLDEGGAVVAMELKHYFPSVPQEVLAASIDRYVTLGFYNRTGELSRSGFERLRQSMLSSGFITRGAEYEACVDNTLIA